MNTIDNVLAAILDSINTLTCAQTRTKAQIRLISDLAWNAASAANRAAELDPVFNGGVNEYQVDAEDATKEMQPLVLGIAAQLHIDRPEALKIMKGRAEAFVEWSKNKRNSSTSFGSVKLGKELSHIPQERRNIALATLQGEEAAKESRRDAADISSISIAKNVPMVGVSMSITSCELNVIWGLTNFITGLTKWVVDSDLALIRKQKQLNDLKKLGTRGKLFEIMQSRHLAASSESMDLDTLVESVEDHFEWLLDRSDWLQTPERERINSENPATKQDFMDKLANNEGWATEGDITSGQSDQNDRG